MVKFMSMDEYESSIDIDRTAKNLYNGWLTKINTRYRGTATIDLLPLTMYTFGLVHYLIVLYAHLIPRTNKKWKISEKEAEKLASEFVDRIAQFGVVNGKNFREDAQSLKDAVKEIILDLESSNNLELAKEILSNKIYNIVNARWRNIKREFIEYIIDAELRRFREIEQT